MASEAKQHEDRSEYSKQEKKYVQSLWDHLTHPDANSEKQFLMRTALILVLLLRIFFRALLGFKTLALQAALLTVFPKFQSTTQNVS